LPFYHFTAYDNYDRKITSKLVYGDFTYPSSIVTNLFSEFNHLNRLNNMIVGNGETHRKKLVYAFKESKLTDYYILDNTVDACIFHLPMSIFSEKRKDVNNNTYNYYMFINGINGDYVEFNYKDDDNKFIISDISYSNTDTHNIVFNNKFYNGDNIENTYSSIYENNLVVSTMDDNNRINSGIYNRNILFINDLRMYFENLDLCPFKVLEAV
jgi:hypothetical protein